MINIVTLTDFQYCPSCNTSGFFCYTPSGGDYSTCPSCGEFDFLNWTICQSEEDNLITRFFVDSFNSSINDNKLNYDYCARCRIMYEVGCMHYYAGCADNSYNAHFIKRWKDKTTNIEYHGMPQFNDTNDWFNNANNVDILEMFCPHQNNKCINTGHEMDSDDGCELI